MSLRETLYDSVHQLREVDRRTVQRIMLAGYFNEEEVKRDSLNIQQYIRDSIKLVKNVKSYIYVKGVFYIQLLQSSNIAAINFYAEAYLKELAKRPTLVNSIRVVHQSYENTQAYFKGIDCDNNSQPGPILSETEKTEEQIQDRFFQIYDLFIEGAKKRSENPSHKIGNMILLSNDDMAILISNHFLSLAEYVALYCGQLNVDREQELNYPLPPSFFDIMEFLEVQDYQKFVK